MKAKIKILVKEAECKPEIIDKGDWIDLKSAEDITTYNPQAGTQYQQDNKKFRDVYFYTQLVSLGVCIKVPDGFEAILVPRSSTFKKYGVLQTNSFGVIDGSYCGNDDVWKMPIIMTKESTINKGDRVAQFRIQLSQKATIWQKIKWFFTNGIEIEYVDTLSDNNRGGFGSTGK